MFDPFGSPADLPMSRYTRSSARAKERRALASIEGLRQYETRPATAGRSRMSELRSRSRTRRGTRRSAAPAQLASRRGQQANPVRASRRSAPTRRPRRRRSSEAGLGGVRACVSADSSSHSSCSGSRSSSRGSPPPRSRSRRHPAERASPPTTRPTRCTPAWTTLGNIVIAEAANGDMPLEPDERHARPERADELAVQRRPGRVSFTERSHPTSPPRRSASPRRRSPSPSRTDNNANKTDTADDQRHPGPADRWVRRTSVLGEHPCGPAAPRRSRASSTTRRTSARSRWPRARRSSRSRR